MNPRIASSMFAAACVAAASEAHALPLTDRTSIELFAGGNVSTPGSFRGPAFIEGPNGNTAYTRLNYDDAYKHDYTTGVELAFNVNPHVSAFAQADYSQFNGQLLKIGQLDSPTGGRFPSRRVSAIPIPRIWTWARATASRRWANSGGRLSAPRWAPNTCPTRSPR